MLRKKSIVPRNLALDMHRKERTNWHNTICTSHLCPLASLRATYFRHILFKFLFDMNKFVPLIIFVRWVKNYLYLTPQSITIARYKKLLMPAVSTTHFAALTSICFQQAGMHAHAHATASLQHEHLVSTQVCMHAYAHSHWLQLSL